MTQTHFTRIRIGKAATNRLHAMKARTGLTPNLLCRFAICYSLAHPGSFSEKDFETGGQEFNRSTLTGEWDPLFLSLIREAAQYSNTGPADLGEQVKAHINRGVGLIFLRLRDLTDLPNILTQDQETRGAAQ